MATDLPVAGVDFEFIRKLVYERSAIVLEPSKTYLVESRLTPLALREGCDSLGTLVNRLRQQRFGNLHRKVVAAMTTNETSFFRDLHPFDALRGRVVPDLIAKRRSERSLHIWCAACSCGQEPYSVAMVLRESFPELASWTVRIVATDLSGDVLGRARRGVYNQLEVNRGLPSTMLVKYFERRGAEWHASSALRAMIEFRELNLIDPWPALPRVDVVFLRNVLIYFDIETKRTILAKTRGLMRSDAYLFLGGAETTMGIDDAFERIQLDRAGVYRIRQAAR